MAYTRILLRRDTKANWEDSNPILDDGEVGVEIETGKFKVGKGGARWSALGYCNPKIDNTTINANGELVVRYEDGTTTNTGRVKGRSVSEQVIEYGVSNDSDTKPVSWGATVPAVDPGKYLWTKTTTLFDDGTSATPIYSYSRQSENGAPGREGVDGVSVVSVLKTGTSGNTDTYTITYSDGTTSTFDVTNGSNATQYYIHYVYADTVGQGGGANYSTNQTRKYIGTYVDTEANDAATYAAANAKSGIVWSQVTGDNGISSHTMCLTNDYDSIPCSAQGNIPRTYDWRTNTSHTLTVFDGVNPVSFRVKQGIPLSNTGYLVAYVSSYVTPVYVSGATEQTEDTSYTAYISGLSADKGVVTYKLYKDMTELAEVSFMAVKNYAGQDGEDAVDYWLTPDVNTIKIAEDGTITPSTVTVNFYKQVGQNDAVLNENSTYRWYKIGEAATTTHTGTATTGIATITIPSDITSGIVIEFYNDDVIYDRETIATVIDGIDGVDGDSVHIKSTPEACTQLGDGYIGDDKHIYFLSALDPRTWTDAGHIGGPKGDQGDPGADAISYWIDLSSNVHTGYLNSENIVFSAYKQVGSGTAALDDDAYLRYKWQGDNWPSGAPYGWTKTNTVTLLKANLYSRDLIIEAAHKPASSYVKYDSETITYSPKNTPVVDLDNDTGAIAYDATGQTKITASDTVSSTASVYLNGTDISSSCTITWVGNGCTITQSGATVTVSALSTNKATASCTVTNIPNYPSTTLTKNFVIVKQLQGKSIEDVVEYYLATNLSSGVTTDTPGWVNMSQPGAVMPVMDDSHPYLWNYERIVLSSGFKETDPALIGRLGEDGNGIANVTDYYFTTSITDASQLPAKGSSSWKTTPTNVNNVDKYLWNYENILWTSGLTSSSTPSIIGAYGQDGQDGADGQDGLNGTSVSLIEEYYLAYASDTGVTTSTPGWQKDTVVATSAAKPYLWNYEKVYGTNAYGLSVLLNTTTPIVIGNYSEDGENGRGISSVINYYKLTTETSPVPAKDNTWSQTPQSVTSTYKYLWNYEKVTYTDSTSSETDVSIIGAFGETGAQGPQGVPGQNGTNGTDGVTIVSSVNTYAGTNTTAKPSASEYHETIPSTDNYKYIWRKNVITYSKAVEGSTTKTTEEIISARGKDGQDGSDADVTFANCCSALGISQDTSGAGIYQDRSDPNNPKLAINANVIFTDQLLATKISTVSATAQNLQVNAANITGSLVIGQLPNTVAQTSDISSAITTYDGTLGALAHEDSLTASDVGARADNWTPTMTEVGVPSWAQNSTKPSYTASEVGATTLTEVAGELSDSSSNIYTGVVSIADGCITAEKINALNITANAIDVKNASNQTIFSANASTKNVTAAGFTFSNNALYAEATGNKKVTISPTAIKLGTSGSEEFQVTNAGSLTAKKGTIGGFTLDNTKLYTNNKSSLTKTGNGIYLAPDGLAIDNSFVAEAGNRIWASKLSIGGTYKKALADDDSIHWVTNVTLSGAYGVAIPCTLVDESASPFDMYATEPFAYVGDLGGYFGTCLYKANDTSLGLYFFAMVLVVVEDDLPLAAVFQTGLWFYENNPGVRPSRMPYYEGGESAAFNDSYGWFGNVYGPDGSIFE